MKPIFTPKIDIRAVESADSAGVTGLAIVMMTQEEADVAFAVIDSPALVATFIRNLEYSQAQLWPSAQETDGQGGWTACGSGPAARQRAALACESSLLGHGCIQPSG